MALLKGRAVALELEYEEENVMESLTAQGNNNADKLTRLSRASCSRPCRVVGTLAFLLITACTGFVLRLTKTPEDLDTKNSTEPLLVPIQYNDRLHNVTVTNSSLMDSQDDETPPLSQDKEKEMVQIEAQGVVYNVSKQAEQQIANYRRGTGLILHIHITHHAGTTFCTTVGHSPDAVGGSAPSFACTAVKPEDNVTDPNFPESNKPWTREETSKNVAIVRKYFHMLSMEFGYSQKSLPHPPLSVMDWENPNLFSVIVMRDPISRLLAGDGWVNKNFPDISRGNATEKDWWGYANNTWFTNNYALRVLAGDGCCDGAKTDPTYLENAKALMERFSIVLDMECIAEGIEAVGSLLNITLARKDLLRKKKYIRPSSRERIGHDNVYEFLLDKNRLDIELYEWSKNLALVKCSMVR